MTYKSTSHYAPVSAAGVIGRLALAMHYTRSAASAVRLSDEESVRKQLLSEVRAKLGLAANDNSRAALEAIVADLYAEQDALLARREEAELTKVRDSYFSDQYVLIAALGDGTVLHDRSMYESRLVEKTIQFPDMVYSHTDAQRFGINNATKLYVRAQPQSRYPYTLLVVAKIVGRVIKAAHILRYYPGEGFTTALPGSLLKPLLAKYGDNITTEILVETLANYDPKSTVVGIYAGQWVFALYQGGDLGEERALGTLLSTSNLPGFDLADTTLKGLITTTNLPGFRLT